MTLVAVASDNLYEMGGPAAVSHRDALCHCGLGEQPKMARMLVVDDENGPRQALRMLLKEEFSVYLAEGVDSALKILEAEQIDIIITDIRMPNQSGLDLLREAKRRYPDIQVIILTGYGQLDTAVEAIEGGAFAYIEKPFDNTVILEKIQACLRKQRQEHARRALEYLALEANRFETMGHLVSGAMHDLGTPLSVIATNLDLLLSRMAERNMDMDIGIAPDKQDLLKRLETMRGQVKHCSDLVRTTMSFIRRAPGSRVSVSLNNVAEMCLEVARPFLVSHCVAPETELAPGLQNFQGDLVMVRQAVLNLIYNASQAMNDQDYTRQIKLRTWMEPGYIGLSVEDTGPGVLPEDRERIFETLYTTKGKNGTGLGLTVVKHVMEEHGGEVWLEHPPMRGARFVLRFPAP